MQLFRPDNEYDIKLAFEGKIKLTDSQMQMNVDINPFDIELNIFEHEPDIPNIELNHIDNEFGPVIDNQNEPISINIDTEINPIDIVQDYNRISKIQKIKRKIKRFCCKTLKFFFDFFCFLFFKCFVDLFDNYKNYKDYETQKIFLKFIKNSIYFFIFLIYYPIHFHIAILYILLEIIKRRRNIIIKDFLFGYFFIQKIYRKVYIIHLIIFIKLFYYL